MSMTWPSLNASPCQPKWDSRSLGAFTDRDPTMNLSPASSRSFRFVDESIPASATTTMSASPCRSWNCFTIGTMVSVVG